MKKQELLKLFGIPDAFEGFEPVPNTKLWGWNGDRAIFPNLIKHLKPSLIIEVGSWMGQSAVNLASSCLNQGLVDTTVICVDTWLGSKEHWRDPTLIQHLELKNGYPDFYRRFLTNMVQTGVKDLILPLPMPSQIAASYLKDFAKIQANLIYLDGSHDTKDVYEDLMTYWSLLTPGGIIFGDDFPWDSVADAVKAFCSEKGITYVVNDINWILQKSI